jgi:predicted nucleotidyltransferase component of viral defense system
LNDKPTLQDLLEIQEQFGLPSASLVEKDWYVVRALAAIAAVDAEPFRLVFGGGTALSRAHGLIRRMSEDIDLKIVGGKPTRGTLGALRDKITKALQGAGFVFDPGNEAHRKSMYERTYTIYRLPYKPISEGKGVLRPEIQIETSVFPARRPSVDRRVTSFIAEGYGRPAEVPSIACSAVVESAAEKFVALTRRVGAQLAGLREDRDPTLVRHIYDLHVIRDYTDAADVATLAHEVMVADAAKYGARFPAYRDDPLAETLRAIESIAADPVFAEGYANFRRDMVYGDSPDFATAVGTLKAMAGDLGKRTG